MGLGRESEVREGMVGFDGWWSGEAGFDGVVVSSLLVFSEKPGM